MVTDAVVRCTRCFHLQIAEYCGGGGVMVSAISVCCMLPLDNNDRCIELVKRVRGMKDTCRLTAAEINHHGSHRCRQETVVGLSYRYFIISKCYTPRLSIGVVLFGKATAAAAVSPSRQKYMSKCSARGSHTHAAILRRHKVEMRQGII